MANFLYEPLHRGGDAAYALDRTGLVPCSWRWPVARSSGGLGEIRPIMGNRDDPSLAAAPSGSDATNGAREKFPLLSESFVEELRPQSDFAELWLLHLHGRWEKVCTAVERLTPIVSGDSHQWRILGDFAHIDGRAATSDESEAVHLARRRRLWLTRHCSSFTTRERSGSRTFSVKSSVRSERKW